MQERMGMMLIWAGGRAKKSPASIRITTRVPSFPRKHHSSFSLISISLFSKMTRSLTPQISSKEHWSHFNNTIALSQFIRIIFFAIKRKSIAREPACICPNSSQNWHKTANLTKY